MEQTSPTPITPKPRIGPWRIFFGLLIIIAGFQLLAQQYGWSWAWSVDWDRIWPLFVILLGLSFMFRPRGRYAWILPVAAVLLVGTLFAAPSLRPIPGNNSYERTVAVARDASATSGALHLDIGATEFSLRGLATEEFLTGHFSSTFADLQQTTVLTDGVQSVTLKNKTGTIGWWGNHHQDLDLEVTNALPLDLDISAGASQSVIDLSAVRLHALDISSGAGQLTLTLGPTEEGATADINAGASSIDITAPKDLGIIVTINAGFSGKSLPEFSETGKGQYRSTNYDSATHRVTMDINAGASSINFHWQ